ncbi:MAG: hypothetical protein GTO53_05525 [Planctomycetales bacterium]|nr:hypothetical protein [Planctomycetales bacterium]NIM08608.1 hypothetical protein [Planctomycetales bacterium]NIN08076.1 hypothetical protein [Planctomycetales bacterium]NIN77210.1 hypothetical protein [Planctomycetales bacterium]NIO34392.1 hypothetical protein [Planctomycetales bacterium]
MFAPMQVRSIFVAIVAFPLAPAVGLASVPGNRLHPSTPLSWHRTECLLASWASAACDQQFDPCRPDLGRCDPAHAGGNRIVFCKGPLIVRWVRDSRQE